MPYLNGIIGDASNLSFGSNPPYAIEDFLQVYPQFGNDANNNSVIPTAIIQMYINLATTCIKKDKWFDAWEVAMGWFIAHFLTLYLQGTADPNSGAAGVLQAGQTRGRYVCKCRWCICKYRLWDNNTGFKRMGWVEAHNIWNTACEYGKNYRDWWQLRLLGGNLYA